MKEQELSVGIDIGTGSIKVVALSFDTTVCYSAHYYYRNVIHSGLLDPLEISEIFFLALKEVSQKQNCIISAITISSCMHSLLLIDALHNPLTPLITWADNRSSEIAEKLRNSSIAEQIYNQTGAPIHAMLPLCKIMWFNQNETVLFNSTAKFISIKEFIWYRLFQCYEVDYSIAAATGLFNISSFNWNQESLRLANINEDQLSAIVSSHLFRTYNFGEFQFLENINFYIGSSDGCLANIGSYVVKPSQAAITVGTSGAVRITKSTPVLNFKTMNFSYPLTKELFISGGPINNGGNVVKWFFKVFLQNNDPSENDYNQLFDQVKIIPAGSEGLMFLPFINGERAPVWDENSSGVFIGISSKHTHLHFFNAALEGVCFALNSILSNMEIDNKITEIHASGSIIKQAYWMQMLADITGKKILTFHNYDASALGAAFLPLQTYSKKTVDDFQFKPLNILNPSLTNKLLYSKYIHIFNGLYENNRVASASLNSQKGY